ncbi:hypothetical protein [Bradyrhizobium sp. UNPF46]|uniref:hypothetical protein n=1 Tax=Bradyrhizobium sp. UNPF46 TaxID=1141168 RepID=UPI00114E5926|nr:hypothetical protein [Bradyrhizobium sp. UNPF46]
MRAAYAILTAIDRRRNQTAFDKAFLNARSDGGGRHHTAVKVGRIAEITSAERMRPMFPTVVAVPQGRAVYKAGMLVASDGKIVGKRR